MHRRQRFRLLFLSTLPARGATRPITTTTTSITNFYPRSPRGERRCNTGKRSTISSFLSTLPARGATYAESSFFQFGPISIHAPREGSDPMSGSKRWASTNFYPRSPRGERRNPIAGLRLMLIFLSTLPARGATPAFPVPVVGNFISIHAPREGSDRHTN